MKHDYLFDYDNCLFDYLITKCDFLHLKMIGDGVLMR